MGLTLAIDFGSTFTKVAAFDLDKEELVAVVKAHSTVETDITTGLNEALAQIRQVPGFYNLDAEHTLACSSAAGGLRMVVAGLVSELTTKAAREAAFGAGAKVVGTYSSGVSHDDVKAIEEIGPDIVLLTGGTDGGNTQVIINNARVLAAAKLNAPIIIAGNKMAAQEACSHFEAAGKYAVITENVLPELNRINIEPTRTAIRDIFIQRITHAKGLDKAKHLVGRDIIPTPLAVLRGASLLAGGVGDELGFGELMVVDVGGATTDVSSIAQGQPSCQSYIFRGLPEPYEKRTVEGDLGIRHNAQSILDVAGKEKIMAKIKRAGGVIPQHGYLEEAIKYLAGHPDTVPQNNEDFFIDLGLASAAVDIAASRHAGSLQEVYYPSGKANILYGKDLTQVKTVIGTGGVFAYGREPRWILESACFNEENPESLRPAAPDYFVDESYIMFAVGLLAEVSPQKALRIMKKHLRRL